MRQACFIMMSPIAHHFAAHLEQRPSHRIGRRGAIIICMRIVSPIIWRHMSIGMPQPSCRARAWAAW
jgi:hypothetical protein